MKLAILVMAAFLLAFPLVNAQAGGPMAGSENPLTGGWHSLFRFVYEYCVWFIFCGWMLIFWRWQA